MLWVSYDLENLRRVLSWKWLFVQAVIFLILKTTRLETNTSLILPIQSINHIFNFNGILNEFGTLEFGCEWVLVCYALLISFSTMIYSGLWNQLIFINLLCLKYKFFFSQKNTPLKMITPKIFQIVNVLPTLFLMKSRQSLMYELHIIKAHFSPLSSKLVKP